MRTDIQDCISALSHKIKGKDEQLLLALICLLAKGHLLLEDLPGMGKTTLSQSLSTVIGLHYARVQFTSDLLPADILGVNIYQADEHKFTFHPGPIFNQVLLADEINRASPKTQSALLEAMAEQQVTIDGTTHALPQPFFVIATQNPLFQSGTYPLPESQLDRFTMRLSLGFPDHDAEKAMLMQQANDNVLSATLTPQDVLQAQHDITHINVSEAVVNYILKLVNATRHSADYPHALSPRASKAIYRCAQALAYVQQRDYVIPEDVQFVLPAVTEHRLKGQDSTALGDNSLSEQLLKQVDPLAA